VQPGIGEQPTGLGKSTTLVARVDYPNHWHFARILTIEFVHSNQREVYSTPLPKPLIELPISSPRERKIWCASCPAQTLLKKIDDKHIATHEIMVSTQPSVILIQDNRVAKLYSLIQTG